MKKRPLIVHLILSLNSGGSENVLLKTLPRLQSNFEHCIVTLREPGELAKTFEQTGIRVINLGLPSFWDQLRGDKLHKAINELRPTLIITHMFHADLAGRLLLQRRGSPPVVASLVTTYNFRKYWPARWFERLTKQWARRYIANSEAVQDFYVTHFGVKAEKIQVIHNGIDVSLYDQATGRGVVTEFRLPKDRLVITCVANLAKNKGHSYLLEAFETVFKNSPDVFLFLVGEGQERSNLQAQRQKYRSKDRIIFLGRRNDVPEILAVSDIFVLPTLFEGLSNAILEAMAAGLAIITTNIPENRVTVRHKKTGLLVGVSSSTEVATALKQLATNRNLMKQLGSNARDFVEKHFDLQVVAAKWDDELETYLHG